MWLFDNIQRSLVKIMLAALFLLSADCVLAGQDWEYWSTYSLKIPYRKGISFNLEPQFKFKNNFREFYYSKTYLGLFYKASKIVDVGCYYAYKTKKVSSGWNPTDLLYLDTILMLNLLGADVSNRFRLEYDIGKNKWVYRNRIKLGKKLNRKVDLFVKEESFLSFSDNRFEENRLSAGSTMKISMVIRISGDYMLNSKRSGQIWKFSNVLVTGLSLAL
jgi:hypothetical protein